MKVSTEKAELLMKRLQIGVGGRGALDVAHSLIAECYGTIGSLVQERDALVKELADTGRQRDAQCEIVSRAGTFLNQYVAKAEEMHDTAAEHGVSANLHTNHDAIEARKIVAEIEASRRERK